MKNPIWRSIAATSGARMYSLAVGMVSLIAVARWLGPEGRGVLAIANSWNGLIVTFGTLSLGQVALHRAGTSGGRDWLPDTFGALAGIAAAISVIGALVTIGVYTLNADGPLEHLTPALLVLTLLLLPLQVWERYGSSLLIALDRLRTYNRALIAGRTLTLVLVVVLLLALDGGIAAALAATLAGQLVVFVAGLGTIWRRAGARIRTSGATARGMILDGLKLHANAIGTAWITFTNVFLLEHFRGTAETGYYTTGMDLVNILLIVAQSAATVLYARIATHGADEGWRVGRQVLVRLAVGAIALAAVASLALPFVVTLVLGERFAPTAAMTRLLVWTVVPQTISMVMAPQWVARGKFVEASVLTVACGLLNLVLNVQFIPRWGMWGAAVGMLIAYSGVMVANIVFALRIGPAPVPVAPVATE